MLAAVICCREFSISWLKLLANAAYLQVISASVICIFKFFCNCSSTIIGTVGLIQHSWKLQFMEICVLSKGWRVSQGRLCLTEKKAFAGPSSNTNSRCQGVKNEASGNCLVAQWLRFQHSRSSGPTVRSLVRQLITKKILHATVKIEDPSSHN